MFLRVYSEFQFLFESVSVVCIFLRNYLLHLGYNLIVGTKLFIILLYNCNSVKLVAMTLVSFLIGVIWSPLFRVVLVSWAKLCLFYWSFKKPDFSFIGFLFLSFVYFCSILYYFLYSACFGFSLLFIILISLGGMLGYWFEFLI